MNALLSYFIDLCLLRAAPQDLPASEPLFWLATLVNVLVETLLLGIDSASSTLSILEESLFEMAIMLLTLQIALQWQAKEPRFRQTATAILGSSSLLGMLIAVVPNFETADFADIALLLLLAIFVWHQVVMGHILRHAFEITLGQGIMASVIYTLMSYLVLNTVFP